MPEVLQVSPTVLTSEVGGPIPPLRWSAVCRQATRAKAEAAWVCSLQVKLHGTRGLHRVGNKEGHPIENSQPAVAFAQIYQNDFSVALESSDLVAQCTMHTLDTIHMNMAACALAIALSSSLLLAGHAVPIKLQSSVFINPSDPVSATSADLVNDPQGRGHLLVRFLFQQALEMETGIYGASALRSNSSQN